MRPAAHERAQAPTLSRAARQLRAAAAGVARTHIAMVRSSCPMNVLRSIASRVVRYTIFLRRKRGVAAGERKETASEKKDARKVHSRNRFPHKEVGDAG